MVGRVNICLLHWEVKETRNDKRLATLGPGAPASRFGNCPGCPPTLVLPTPEGYTPGYVLLAARNDRPLRAWADHLEFRDDPP